ncbi:MAG TPA: NAD(+) diphosphatase [Pseudoclavibacter sp.]|nr:NAD(+) diphosphatase [Pseudoclavibacter sp.]
MLRQLSIDPPLARAGVDRDSVVRSDPKLFDRLLSDGDTRILALHAGRVPMSDGHLVLCRVEDVTSALVRAYLGRTLVEEQGAAAGAAIILNILSDNAQRELASRLDAEWVELRDIGGVLTDRDAGLVVEAVALSRWHENYQYCPRCGLPNIVGQAGWVRRCPDDGFEVYPRIDPAIIVAIRDQHDRLLLGGGRAGWYSVLAGFVEAGEPLEAAVVREVREESGLNVAVDAYLGSQSWPYPLSLMLAFSARVTDDDADAALHPDGEEITHLEWFTREDLWRRKEQLRLPGTASIARAMIESWLGRPLDAGDEHPEPTPAPNTFLAGTDIP